MSAAVDNATIPGTAAAQRGAARARSSTTGKVARRVGRAPSVRSGLGSVRGFAAGSLALIALQVLGSRAEQFGGFLSFTATLLEHAVSPNVPAIPWLSKTGPSASAGTAQPTSNTSTQPGTALTVTPVFGINPAVAYGYSAPLLTQQSAEPQSA